jgi:signal peptidase I
MEVHSFVYMPSLELCEQSVAAPAAETASAAVNTTIPVLAVTDKLAEDKPAVNADLGLAAAPPVTAEPLASAAPVADEPAAKAAENEGCTHTAPVPAVRARRFWRVSTRRLIVLASIVLGMRIFVGEASVVPTASMEGTILVGDHLFMDKLLYGPEIPLVHWRLPMVKTIHRGDIIVFHYPRDPSETFLKRVAAVGGDCLEIRNGVLFVNSQPVQEPYAVHHAPLHNPQESWGPVVVPDGKLFVMGDNRDNSSDSRDWGFVPVGNVIGEPMFVYWSYDAPTARWLDENPGHRITFYASIAENFFSRTRWSRTGMLL